MKELSEYLAKSLNSVVESKLSSEEDFREMAEKKFKAVFKDELDEDKMNETIDGIIEDNKELVEDGKWDELIGILNKSFNEDFSNEDIDKNEEELFESKCHTIDADKLSKMSEDELWDTIGEVAAAKALCRKKNDKKGEEECATTLKEIREILKNKN